MKLVILYHPQSESSRAVEEFVHEYERTIGSRPDLVSLETPDGASTARLYDIVQYPAILALRDDGELLKAWQGELLPLRSEVAAYERT